MTDIPNAGGDAAGERSLAPQSQTFSVTASKVPLTIDIAKISVPMKKFFDDMHKQAETFIADMNKMGEALGEVPQGGGQRRAAGTPAQPTFQGNSKAAQAVGGAPGAPATSNYGGRLFMRPLQQISSRISQVSGVNIGAGAIGAAGVAAALSQVVGAADQRIARGAEYASGADKLSVLTQQMTGMSQRQVMNMRQPLTNYRLGAGGINQMLAFQASTGVQATPQFASSIAGIRAATGYSKSTGDILADQQALLNPEVANRMLFQLGTNAYTTGGKQRDPMQMRQQIIQSMGLNNSLVLKGALSPGSITRARMTQAGVPVEMQDDLIQQAQMNQSFRQKGGKGSYDPRKEADRKRMGIEGNLATQQQETERLRGQREEQFMSRQIDNMTTAEKQNQEMIRILGNIEGKLSGPIGARTSTAGLQKLIGRGMQIGGLGIAALTGVETGGVGAAVGLGISAAGTAMVGDPVDGETTKPGGGANALAAQRNASFRGLNPKMQERLLKMFAANPKIGFGGGTRSSSQQEAMFRSRYKKTNTKTPIFWEGSYWEHTSGAPAAPPGRSMHEIGLAADLTGDMSWISAHASEFGLKNFAQVNGEPWHVQPTELPNSRRDYEASGSPWGGERSTEKLPAGVSTPEVLGDVGSAKSSYAGGASTLNTHSGMSISEIIAVTHSENVARLGGGSGIATVRKSGAAGTPAVASSASSSAIPKGTTLSGVEVARVAYEAGFRGQALIDWVGIAMRESHGNSLAHNPKPPDDSFGLWQINMLGALGPDRIKKFGLKAKEDLYDPRVNARAAYEMSGGGSNHGPWTIKGNWAQNVDLKAASNYVTQANLGDPMPMERSGGSSTYVNTGHSINFAPTIIFQGTPQTPDLQKLAAEAGRLLKEQVKTLELRNA
jgi:hypothetical protein